LRRADVEWAFSGLETVDRETGVVGPFVLTRSDGDTMLRHYLGPARRWRSVTAVVLPENAKRRRIEPSRRTAEAKPGSERLAEEQRAAAAVQLAFTQAGVRVGVTNVHVRREPFDARGSRVEAFADGTRFAKERLWHVDVELDRAVEGPIVIGDGRFLGLGVLAPVTEPWRKVGDDVPRSSERGPILRGTNSPGLFGFAVGADAKDNPAALAIALRRAVMARVQAVLGRGRLGPFFSGHREDGTKAVSDHSNHLAFQWEPLRRRLLVIAPHSLDRREPSRDERAAINVLKEALEGFVELRAGLAGRFAVSRCSISDDDPLLAPSQTWASLTPYLATRHQKHAMVADALADDVIAECHPR
jgi:CRISPR-associated protein Csb2